MTATDPAAIISVIISAANTLDHHQTFGVDDIFLPLGDALLKLQVSHDPVIFPVKVFGRFMDIGTYCNYRCAMFYLPDPSLSNHSGDEIPHITRNIRDGGFMGYMYQGIFINRADHILQIGLNIHTFEGRVKSSRRSPQIFILFHQVNLMTLVSYGERTGQAGYPATNHQCSFVHWQIKFL